MSRAIEDGELRNFADKHKQDRETSRVAETHRARLVDVPTAEGASMKTNCGCRHRGLKKLKAGRTTSWAALDKLSDVRRHPSPLVAVCNELADSSLNTWMACIGIVSCVDEKHPVFADV